MQAMPERNWEFVVAEGNNHQIGRSEGDLCPTATCLAELVAKNAKNTYAALQRPAMNVAAAQLADGHCRILVCIHLHERKAAVRLKPSLNDVTKIREKRYKIILVSVWSKISNIASGLPMRSLLYHHVIALDTMGRKMMMTEGCGGGHSHCGHGLLL